MQLSSLHFVGKSVGFSCAKIFSADAWQSVEHWKLLFGYRKLEIVRLKRFSRAAKSDSMENLCFAALKLFCFSCVCFLRFKLRHSKADWAGNWRKGFINYVMLQLNSEKISTGVCCEIVNLRDSRALSPLTENPFLRLPPDCAWSSRLFARSVSKASIIN